ncbi:hypothetical protein TARUN_8772 [Trichoderma arundinaceum]|uniref:Uncharacterized protein n=1 Tax=Trichoderma arundinaceum TaxID=490622 RepID=A0A395NCF6_TRIAR|nr:hypothetical protein TARUN_8772 [Trichoderma arundinaceum]
MIVLETGADDGGIASVGPRNRRYDFRGRTQYFASAVLQRLQCWHRHRPCPGSCWPAGTGTAAQAESPAPPAAWFQQGPPPLDGALAVAAFGPSSGPSSGSAVVLRWPCAGCGALHLAPPAPALSPLPYIQTQSPASPSPILLHSSHLLCAVASVRAIPPVGRRCVLDCEQLNRRRRPPASRLRPSFDKLFPPSRKRTPLASLHRTTQTQTHTAAAKKRTPGPKACPRAQLPRRDDTPFSLLLHECLILADEHLSLGSAPLSRAHSQIRAHQLVDASDRVTASFSIVAQPLRPCLCLVARSLASPVAQEN